MWPPEPSLLWASDGKQKLHVYYSSTNRKCKLGEELLSADLSKETLI